MPLTATVQFTSFLASDWLCHAPASSVTTDQLSVVVPRQIYIRVDVREPRRGSVVRAAKSIQEGRLRGLDAVTLRPIRAAPPL
jgi:hypothetical protein